MSSSARSVSCMQLCLSHLQRHLFRPVTASMAIPVSFRDKNRSKRINIRFAFNEKMKCSQSPKQIEGSSGHNICWQVQGGFRRERGMLQRLRMCGHRVASVDVVVHEAARQQPRKTISEKLYRVLKRFAHTQNSGRWSCY